MPNWKVYLTDGRTKVISESIPAVQIAGRMIKKNNRTMVRY